MSDDSVAVDDKIAYHEEMERIAMQAGDFTKTGHHRKMQEIYKAIKEALTAVHTRSI
jgi:predicted transcriptional regulator YdeE